MRRTKIVCTLGPATDDEEVLRAMMLNGLNVARLNFSHGDHQEHKKRMDMVKRLRSELDLPIAMLLDTRGPEIRVKSFAGDSVELAEGQKFTFTSKEVIGTNEMVSITYPELYTDVAEGTRILLDDGLIDMRVDEISDGDIICTVQTGGVLGSNKSMNIPSIHINMEYLNDKDREDILFGIKNGIDFVAASFVRSRDDVLDVRRLLEENGGQGIQIISKIENGEGVENCDDILRVTDGIMIARGDMGVEIPFEEIPKIQKKLISKCRSAGKYVITATQMLDSMIRNPRPTRAETTDVANAIYDGTAAIMLSGETSVGKYPVEAVITMNKIAEITEGDINYYRRFRQYELEVSTNVTNAISHATCMTAHDLGASAIISITKSGHTARMVSKFRPECPIVAATNSEQVCRQLSLSWGVYPYIISDEQTTDALFDAGVEAAIKSGCVTSGDLVVISAGVPVGISGTTNILKVHIVGNVLVKGERVNQQSVCGNLCVCRNEEEAKANFKSGDILVIPETSNEILSLLKHAKGIITEKAGKSSHAAIVGLTLDIPVVCGAENATSLLKSGTIVTIDSARGLVFSGESYSAGR